MLKLTLMLLAFAFVLFLSRSSFEMGKIVKPKRVVFLTILYMIFISVVASIGQIPSGHRGVVLRFSAITGRVLGEGIYVVAPFVESVQVMDVQTHAYKTPANGASHDLQDVTTAVTLNYKADPLAVDVIYQDLREDYVERIIVPAVQDAVKASTAQYDAEDLIQKRATVKSQMEADLGARLAKHHILLDTISITDFKFSKDFTEAIEQKVVAAQTALRAKNDLIRIQTEADQRVATATAEATAIEIQAKAIQAQGGGAYVNLKAIEKWDGKLPTWTGGGALPFVNLGAPAESRK